MSRYEIGEILLLVILLFYIPIFVFILKKSKLSPKEMYAIGMISGVIIGVGLGIYLGVSIFAIFLCCSVGVAYVLFLLYLRHIFQGEIKPYFKNRSKGS